ncbi:hypothetical protein Xgly_16475 [Xanthomonas citri pv. glycines]|uniref:Uncharacterized protein n=1 Tax=Xanthomonas campestris pv. glycines TaxID=473421 RepID=A0AAX0I2L5_XANCG|nr:hypothetical protein A9D66_09915 [Xanthomonas citri pv. glycines str. 12-2]OEY91079.1 hypothetical protein BIY41_10490 [Xanthomonas citri pv. glycines]OOX02161.1 hypothetical protein Xgly_16475 [Xanthomonas citri pv. glycines]
MVIALIAKLTWRVDRNEDGHLEALDEQLTQRQGEHSSLVWIKLVRKRHLDFSANACVLAGFGRFVRVPKILCIKAPLGRSFRRKHLMEIDTASVGIIVAKPCAHIEQIKPCAVSRCCDRRVAVASAERLHCCVINCHL